jgi:hypothetical protein
MRKAVIRAALAAAGFVAAASLAPAAQATDFSIDTAAPGDAWVINPPGYLTGTIHDGTYSVTAYIGVINLKGKLVNDPDHPMTDLKVFCIDLADDLQHHDIFTERSIADLENTSSNLNVHFNAQRVSDLTKFLAYASIQGINDPTSSAVAQLGVWEIIAESDGNEWDLGAGNLKVTGLASSVIAQANQWLAASQSQSVSGYTLHVLDPGAGNQVQAFVTHNPGGSISEPGVPEPATWGMIVVGFGLLGAALRRRKPEQLPERFFA